MTLIRDGQSFPFIGTESALDPVQHAVAAAQSTAMTVPKPAPLPVADGRIDMAEAMSRVPQVNLDAVYAAHHRKLEEAWRTADPGYSIERKQVDHE